MKIKALARTALPLLALAGCANTAELSDTPDHDGQEGVSMAEQMHALERDLKLGDEGDDVAAVHAYLTRFGYFPSAELAAQFPAWRPIVEKAPASEHLFDEQSRAAVRALQRSAGLSTTGIVDRDTRELLRLSRCAIPDGIAQGSGHEKFAMLGGKWSDGTVSWRLGNTDDVSLADAQAAIARSFATWTNVTSATATRTTGSADIEITFDAIDDSGNTLAQAYGPNNGGDMTIDTAEPWSTANTVPFSSYDLETVVTHELGHSLGLHHSSVREAVMYPFASRGTANRSLSEDDEVAISALYDRWTQVSGTARDIGVGAGGAVWVIGQAAREGGHAIYRWNGSSFVQASGAAVRIAVAPNGVPWVVNSEGEIYQRTTSSATSGSWTKRPGCAKDIGIGADGSVWIVGCTSRSGGFSIHEWNGTSFVESGGGATRVAVAPDGKPWVVNNEGDIYRRTTTTAASGSWEALPGNAHDIGIGPSGYVYVIGSSSTSGGYGIHVWSEQEAVTYSDGKVAAPATKQWVQLAGGATNISVGPDGPWVTNNELEVYHTVR